MKSDMGIRREEQPLCRRKSVGTACNRALVVRSWDADVPGSGGARLRPARGGALDGSSAGVMLTAIAASNLLNVAARITDHCVVLEFPIG